MPSGKSESEHDERNDGFSPEEILFKTPLLFFPANQDHRSKSTATRPITVIPTRSSAQ